MKKTLIALVILGLTVLPLLIMAQEAPDVKKKEKVIIMKNGDNEMEMELQNMKNDLSELKNLNKSIKITMAGLPGEESADAPFFGIIPADLDFPKAQELNYNEVYGILITGIVPDSPAYQYRLIEDDILMEINGKKVLNLQVMDKIKAQYRAGDAVQLSIFREGEIKRIDFVFGSRTKTNVELNIQGEKPKAKKSVGHGGGTWIPMYFTADMEDVNTLVQTLGFSKMPEDGVLTQGLGGKGNVGKGWFLGGQVSFYNDEKKISDVIGGMNYTNSMGYNLIAGGATLDKRFAITKGIIGSMGVMIGGAAHSVELVHSNGDYNWPSDVNSDNVVDTQDVMGDNAFANMSKGYIVVQPRAELMVRILSWLGMRAEVGYMYGYAPTSGWKVSHNDMESYELKNSPDTPFQGMTVTVGPWFGF